MFGEFSLLLELIHAGVLDVFHVVHHNISQSNIARSAEDPCEGPVFFMELSQEIKIIHRQAELDCAECNHILGESLEKRIVLF